MASRQRDEAQFQLNCAHLTGLAQLLLKALYLPCALSHPTKPVCFTLINYYFLNLCFKTINFISLQLENISAFNPISMEVSIYSLPRRVQETLLHRHRSARGQSASGIITRHQFD